MRGWVRGGLTAGAALALMAAGGSAWSLKSPAPPLRPGVAKGASGSAFAVSPGVLVTNAHVLLRCQAQGLPVQVAGRPGLWAVAAMDREADLALLRGPAQQEEVLPLSTALRLPRGAQVVALGYPTDDGHTGGRLRSARGAVLRAALTVHDPQGGRAVSFVMTDRQGREVEPSWDDGLRYFGAGKAESLRWRLEIDAPAAGGSSGGPVLDAGGRVVGVVYAGGRGLTAAIPLEDLRSLLARAGVAPVLRAAGEMWDWPQVEAVAARATYRLSC
jgi:hypothetical protein